MVRPFLRWVGGKKSLLPILVDNLPKGLNDGSINTYIEPFLGAGSLFFWLVEHYPNLNYIISDLNYDLMRTYEIIKFDVLDLITILSQYELEFINSVTDENRSNFYNKIKDMYNTCTSTYGRNIWKIDDSRDFWINRVAQFIILNALGFNGLYRVNNDGLYNVPFGKKTKLTIDYDNLFEVSSYLQTVVISWGGYYDTVNTTSDMLAETLHSKSNIFIYLDPPYRALGAKKSFNKYQKKEFGTIDQLKLVDYYNQWSEQGINIMLSNSDPTQVDLTDSYFIDNYGPYRIKTVSARRSVSGKSKGRGSCRELLILNYAN